MTPTALPTEHAPEVLTPRGKCYAERNAQGSIVCRIALAGYSSPWPYHHVSTAIRVCNEAA